MALALVATASAVLLLVRDRTPSADLTLLFPPGATRQYSLSIDDAAETSDGEPVLDPGFHLTTILSVQATPGEAAVRLDLDGTTVTIQGVTYDANPMVGQRLPIGSDGRPGAMLAVTSDPTGAGYYYADLVFPLLPAGRVGLGETWAVEAEVPMAQGSGGISYRGEGELVRFEELDGVRAAVVQNRLALTYDYVVDAGLASALVAGGDPDAPGEVGVSGSGTYLLTAWVDARTGEVLRSVGKGTYELTAERRGFPETVVPAGGGTSSVSGRYTQQLQRRG
jgi:hypothetical protein